MPASPPYEHTQSTNTPTHKHHPNTQTHKDSKQHKGNKLTRARQNREHAALPRQGNVGVEPVPHNGRARRVQPEALC